MSCGKKTISLKIFWLFFILGSRFSVYYSIPLNAFLALLSFTKSRWFVKSHDWNVNRPPAFEPCSLPLIVVIFILTCQPGFYTSFSIYQEITSFKYRNSSLWPSAKRFCSKQPICSWVVLDF